MSNRERLNQLDREHGELVTQATAINELLASEERGPTPEEKERFKTLLAAAEVKRAEKEEVDSWVEQQEKLAAAQVWREQVQSVTLPDPTPAPGSPRQPDGVTEIRDAGDLRQATRDPQYRAAYSSYLRTGNVSPALARVGEAMTQMAVGMTQLAADDPARTDVDPYGGFLIPDMLADEVTQEMDRMMVIRMLADVVELGPGETMQWPTTKERLGRAQRSGEAGGNLPSGRTQWEMRNFIPTMMWYSTPATRTMLANRHFPIESYLNDELMYTLMYTCEAEFLNGQGGLEAVGLLADNPAGITSARDRNSGAATGVTFAGLFDAKYRGLRPRCTGRARLGCSLRISSGKCGS